VKGSDGCGAQSCDLASERDDERVTWGRRCESLAIRKDLRGVSMVI